MYENIKILAVDDDEMNLEMMALMLSELDCQILKAGNGRQALDMLAANPDADIILMDLEMPVMDGYEAIRLIKESSEWREIPVVVITGGSSEVTRTLALGVNDFLSKPYNPEELRLRVMNHVRSKKLSDLASDVNNVLEREVIKKTAALREALQLSQEAEYEISLRLGRAAEFRDQETGMHTRRISELAKHLGSLAGLDEVQCEILRKASPLHDVGKIGIPDGILLKPGKLDPDEFETMKQHTVIGCTILADAARYPLLDAGSIIALQHHEKWDGSGYPYGLSGHKIHEYARIVSIVDVFDALTSVRPYKPAFSTEKTIGILEEGTGTFFDPHLLNIFLDNIDDFLNIKDTLKDIPGVAGHIG